MVLRITAMPGQTCSAAVVAWSIAPSTIAACLQGNAQTRPEPMLLVAIWLLFPSPHLLDGAAHQLARRQAQRWPHALAACMVRLQSGKRWLHHQDCGGK